MLKLQLPQTHHGAMRTSHIPTRQAWIAGTQVPGNRGRRGSLAPLQVEAGGSMCWLPACSPNKNRTTAHKHTTRKNHCCRNWRCQMRPRAPILCSTKKPLPPSHLGHGACLNARKAHSADVLLSTTGEQTHASRSSHDPLLASLLDNRNDTVPHTQPCRRHAPMQPRPRQDSTQCVHEHCDPPSPPL